MDDPAIFTKPVHTLSAITGPLRWIDFDFYSLAALILQQQQCRYYLCGHGQDVHLA